MPIYEYKCKKCKRQIEMIVNRNEDQEKYCIECNNILTKMMAPCNFKLKGGGWYSDGYSKEG